MWVFRGVPYAQVTGPQGRWRAAQPPTAWTGTRLASSWGPIAPQTPPVPGFSFPHDPTGSDEDCLNLNVWTPALDDGRRPVMVWLHGGGFTTGTGSSALFAGGRLASKGVVVVTINYRLGALGLLTHPDLASPDDAGGGNWSLRDQIAALGWVKENIAGFGGDPDNVTLFGESAGAMSVGTLLGTPAAAGLFAKAIAQSGAAHNVSSADDAAAVTDAFLAELGGDGLEALLAATPERLLEVQQQVAQAMLGGRLRRRARSASNLPFGPVIDGAVLPRHPYEAIRDGSAASVPLLTGTNRDEWNLFVLLDRSVDDAETLIRRVGRIVERPEALVAAYRAARDQDSHDELFKAVMTDGVFRVPAIRMAEAQAAHQPEHTFMYLFEYASTVFDGRLGSAHALEIPFVFDNLDRTGVELLTGPDPPQSVADAMHRAWISFARTGSPAHDGLPDWPPYNRADRVTMGIGTPCHLERDPAGAERLAWSDLL